VSIGLSFGASMCYSTLSIEKSPLGSGQAMAPAAKGDRRAWQSMGHEINIEVLNELVPWMRQTLPPKH
jgi:hypothetical protein